MKKKYFVLRSTSSSGPARLEYYDSEKKFKAGQLPKRSIHLHTCFNINKKSDSRHGKHGIALYTSEDCFTVLAESEKQQEAWLSVILEFQNEYLPDGDMHKEHYGESSSFGIITFVLFLCTLTKSLVETLVVFVSVVSLSSFIATFHAHLLLAKETRKHKTHGEDNYKQMEI